jgi:hypothetical protein
MFALPACAQEGVWKALMSVKSEQRRDAHVPKFDAKQRAYDGKQVTISGYMYAYEEAPAHKFFMLSFYPVSMCYFCGGAGPESVIEVTLKRPMKFTSRQITLKGTLKLNDSDPERLFYFLQNAEEE